MYPQLLNLLSAVCCAQEHETRLFNVWLKSTKYDQPEISGTAQSNSPQAPAEMEIPPLNAETTYAADKKERDDQQPATESVAVKRTSKLHFAMFDSSQTLAERVNTIQQWKGDAMRCAAAKTQL